MKNQTALYVRIPVDLRERIDAAVARAFPYRLSMKGSIAELVIPALEKAFPAPAPAPTKSKRSRKVRK